MNISQEGKEVLTSFLHWPIVILTFLIDQFCKGQIAELPVNLDNFYTGDGKPQSGRFFLLYKLNTARQGQLNSLKVVGAQLTNKTHFYCEKLNSYEHL